jgi:protein tyrosine/serine phosphatase
MRVRVVLSWVLGAAVAVGVAGVPVLHHRLTYTQTKRLRVVTDGRVYRSGQMTAAGFEDAIRKYRLRTVINLQSSDDDKTGKVDQGDPMIPASAAGGPKRKESEVVTDAGAKYLQIDCNSLDRTGPNGYPAVLEDVYKVFDDEANYPILVHCKAGLHRTGLVVAAYRMEYEGWSKADALEELRANGFGTFKATDANVYVMAGITAFEKRQRRVGNRPHPPAPSPKRRGGES